RRGEDVLGVRRRRGPDPDRGDPHGGERFPQRCESVRDPLLRGDAPRARAVPTHQRDPPRTAPPPEARHPEARPEAGSGDGDADPISLQSDRFYIAPFAAPSTSDAASSAAW